MRVERVESCAVNESWTLNDSGPVILGWTVNEFWRMNESWAVNKSWSVIGGWSVNES